MKGWQPFVTLLAICTLLIALAVYKIPETEFLKTLGLLVFLYAAGCLPWLLTRQRFWKFLPADNLERRSDIRAPIARWYRNAMICAFIYGGAVFECSVDHNIMHESCELVIQGQEANWWSHGKPCRLTPVAFLDLASGVGFGLAIFEFPIVVYWLGTHMRLLIQRRKI
jgi:hypothetical protein